MKFKISLLAALLIGAFPFAAKAEDTNSYESLQVSCASGAECSDFGANFQEEGEEVAQGRTRRTRTRRTRRGGSGDSKIYVGGSLAPFIPFDGELDIGFGGGVFAGYKLTENISVELDVFDYFGGLDDDDVFLGDESGYNTFGAALSGVYRYYLNPRDSSESVYIFAGVGGGVGVVSVTGDLSDAIDDGGGDASDVGFLIQGKGGVGYPITDKIDLFGQTRFFSTFLGDDDIFGGDDIDGVAIDVGATFNF